MGFALGVVFGVLLTIGMEFLAVWFWSEIRKTDRYHYTHRNYSSYTGYDSRHQEGYDEGYEAGFDAGWRSHKEEVETATGNDEDEKEEEQE